MKTFAVVTALSLAVLVGCSDDEPEPTTTASADPQAQALTDARAQWDAAGIVDYDWTYELSCYCAGLSFAIEVRDGEPSDFTAGDSGSAALDPEPDDLASAEPRYETIGDLFDEIESDLADEPDGLDVTYDETDGHPTSISIDPDRDTYDDELTIDVTAFESLT